MVKLQNPKPSLAVQPAYIGLAGPTASGKTAAAILIARHHAVEIISVDSALVYKGMDIGTAKPSTAELAAVPHHLINILDPLHSYSAAQFALDAKRLIGEIRARGKLPLLVGGTMLYFKALRDGLDDIPAANLAVRAQINAQAAALGWPALHAELAQVDGASAARLNPNDAQRISRALEVYRSTGRSISSFYLQKSAESHVFIAQHAPDSIAIQTAPLIALEPTDRAWLHQRIAQRMAQMLQAGLVGEVAALRARGDLTADMTAMRCVGYRQSWEYLDSLQATAPLEKMSLLQLEQRCNAATRQLAKRQLTWLRSLPQRHTVACDQPQAAQAVLNLVNSWL